MSNGSAKRVPPKLTVIIPAFERPDALKKVLEGLEDQTLLRAEYEVIVVVDGSHSKVVEVAKTARTSFSLRYFPIPHQGETAARNFGLKQAAAEFIVSLDDDSIPEPQFLERHICRLESEEGIVVCGDVRRHAASPQKSLAEIFDWSEGYHARITQAGYEPSFIDLPDNNFSIRRSHLLQVGGWDEELKGYGGIDDWELGYRLEQIGLRFRFEPGALVYHYYSKSLQSILDHQRVAGRAEVHFFQKHPGAVRGLSISHFMTGEFWRRWIFLGSRRFPNWMLKGISNRVAPLLDSRKLIRSSYFSALLFKGVRTLFRCRGLWDRPDVMKEAYRRFRCRVPIVTCVVGPNMSDDAPMMVDRPREKLGHEYAMYFDALKRKGYQTVSIEEFNLWRLNLGPIPRRPVLLTLRGNPRVIKNQILPLLTKYGFRASYFLNCKMLDRKSTELQGELESQVSREEVLALRENGIEIEAHLELSNLPVGTTGSQIREIIDAAGDSIHSLINRPVRFLSYDANGIEFEVLCALNKSGLWGAIGPEEGLNEFNTPKYALRRIGIDSITGMYRSTKTPGDVDLPSTSMNHWKKHWSIMTRPTHLRDTTEFYELCATELRRLFGGRRPRKVLELGCGSGSLYQFLGFEESEYTGVDFSNSMLAIFRAREPKVHLVYADASSYCDPIGQFDLIFSNGLIQYLDLKMLDGHLGRGRQMLAAEGRIVIGLIPLKRNRLKWYGGVYSGEEHLNWTRLALWFAERMIFGDPIGRWYLLSDISALASKHGFSTEFIDSTNYPFAVHAILRRRELDVLGPGLEK
jgi:glycosyltransferase involved in cell wall biosynthesis/SAM-dependent methyltransferase